MGRLLIANLATSNFRTVQFIGDEGAVAATKIREAEYYRGMCMGHKNETLREDFEREADSLGGIQLQSRHGFTNLVTLARGILGMR